MTCGAFCPCPPGIFSHLERLDGYGYPDRLGCDEIPLVVRVSAVANSFEAKTSEPPCRGPLSADHALKFIHGGAGTKRDAIVIYAFVEVMQALSLDQSAPAWEPLAADWFGRIHRSSLIFCHTFGCAGIWPT